MRFDAAAHHWRLRHHAISTAGLGYSGGTQQYPARQWESTTGVEQVIVDQMGLSKATATLPRWSPGDFTLQWSYLVASTSWQTRTEVAINGTTLAFSATFRPDLKTTPRKSGCASVGDADATVVWKLSIADR